MATATDSASPESHSYVEMRETLGVRLGKTYKDMVDTLGRELAKGDICRCKYKQVRKRLKELAADKEKLILQPQPKPEPCPSGNVQRKSLWVSRSEGNYGRYPTEPEQLESRKGTVFDENQRFKRDGLKLDIKKAQDWGRGEELERGQSATRAGSEGSKPGDILNDRSVEVDGASGNWETEPSEPHAPPRRRRLRPKRVVESPDIARDAAVENEYDPCK